MATLKNLVDETTNIKNELKTCHINLKNNLVEKGIEVSSGDKLATLVEKVKNTQYIEGYDKLPQWYKAELEGQLNFKDVWIACKTKCNYASSKSHAFTLNGKIYHIFPSTSSPFNYCYNPIDDTWTKLNEPTNKLETRGASDLNGRFYFMGGWCDSYYKTTDCYDPSTNTWSTKANMITARRLLTCSTSSNKIYAIGGQDSNRQYLSKNECYDPSTNTWSTMQNMNTSRCSLMSKSINNKIYVIGGSNSGSSALSTTECYDPSTNTWSTKANMITARSETDAVEFSGKIYVIHGRNSSSNAVDINECYDPSTNTWISLKNGGGVKLNPALASVNNVIYSIGGKGSSYSSGTVETVTQIYIP